MYLNSNGDVVRGGLGADVLGDPVDAMVWLANALSRDGGALKQGDIHNTGAAADLFWVRAGEAACAVLSSLGSVRVTIESPSMSKAHISCSGAFT